MRMLAADDTARTSIDGERASSTRSSISWLESSGSAFACMVPVAEVPFASNPGGAWSGKLHSQIPATTITPASAETIIRHRRRFGSVAVSDCVSARGGACGVTGCGVACGGVVHDRDAVTG